MVKIKAPTNVHLLHTAQEAIEHMSSEPLEFFSEDIQPEENELVKRTGGAEAVLVGPGTKVTETYLDRCRNIKYVGVCGTSKTNVDKVAASQRGVVVTNVTDYGDEPTAEFIFMQLLRLVRGVGDYQWREEPHELMGKKIGVVGMGALGVSIASLAKGFKMDVGYFSRTRKPSLENESISYYDKSELLKRSDFIIISTPTDVLALKVEDFGLITDGSVLVQASMGTCFDKNAFIEWVSRDGNFAIFDYAAGNVNYERYKNLEKVVFPKIIAGHTVETRRRLGERVVENLESYLKN